MGFLSRWLGRRRTAPVTPEVPVMVQQEDYATPIPPGKGWRMWSSNISHEDMLTLYTADRVETWRDGYGFAIIKPREMHPATNVHGLWWRTFE